MTVMLSHAPNPDIIGGYWDEPAEPGNFRKVEVKDFDEASRICCEYIARNGLGGGNWTGGAIIEGEKVVARISYNGRIWPDRRVSA